MEPQAPGLAIDWRLIVIQAVNFLLLLGILWWVAWKPLLATIHDRRRLIEEGIKAAKDQQLLAEKTQTERAGILQTARDEAKKLLKETRSELAAEREAHRRELAETKTQERAKMDKEFERQRAKLETDMRQYTAGLVTEALGRILETTPKKNSNFANHITDLTKTVTKSRTQ